MLQFNSFESQYKTLDLVEHCTPDFALDIALPEIWKLDSDIRLELSPIIEQYQNGCLHSMEFYSAIVQIITKARN